MLWVESLKELISLWLTKPIQTDTTHTSFLPIMCHTALKNGDDAAQSPSGQCGQNRGVSRKTIGEGLQRGPI